MSFFKKFKKPKSRQPSKQPTSLGIPTQIAVGALGISADLDLDVRSGGENDGRGSRIARNDSSEVRQPPALGVLTPVYEHMDEIQSTSDASQEQLGHITFDPSFILGRELGAQDLEVCKDQGMVAEHPPEELAEHASKGDRVSQGGYEEMYSWNMEGGPIGESALIPDNEKATRGFGPLRHVLSAVSTNYEENVAVRDKIEGLLSRLVVLEERFDSLPGDSVEQRRRSEVIQKLKDIEEELRLFPAKSEPHQLASPIKGNEQVSGLLEDLREAVFAYQITQQQAIYEQSCKLLNQAEVTVLNNLRRARGAGYRHGGRKGCLKGTREVVLDGIELWARDFNKLPVYWLNGLAGTGKSTIAQTIAERVFADGRLGASFFCSRDFEDRSNLHLIFPTLAVQLAHRYTAFRSILVPLVQSDPDIDHESLYNQMDKLIAQPLKESAISTIIIIDALDECKDDEPASAILSVLGRFVSELSMVKFLLTGRPEPRIRDGFRLPLLVGVTDIFVLHEVKSNQVDSDIQLFFKNSFLELTHRWPELDNWPAKTQLDLLCEQAAGFFVYAVAIVRFIDRRGNNPRTQLEHLLQYECDTVRVGRTRYNTNSTLDSLYISILQEAFGDHDPEDDPVLRSVLGAVVLAANPLSPSSIATLLGLDAEDVTALLLSVHSLLILHDDTNHPVQPFHKSFPDFITNPARCTSQKYHIPPHHHLELLVSCLRLMNQTLGKNMCHLPEAVKNSEVDDLEERKEEYISHALQYACKSWYKHLVDEPTTNRHEITSVLHFFLEKKFLCWLEVLSVFGAVRNAVDALQVATKWLEESQTLDLAKDCSRFVTGFFGVISTSAPHIYHSALLLCPKESIIKTLYGPQIKPLTRVIQGIPASWDPSIASISFSDKICATTWSPCSRFIASTHEMSSSVVVLDAVTLEQLHTMDLQRGRAMWRYITFSPHSHLLTAYSWMHDCIFNWDLQTGGLLSEINTERDVRCTSVSYSECETMFGASFQNSTIIIYNVFSGIPIASHSIQKSIVGTIWTYGEYIQFATIESTYVTVWQVSLTSSSTPTEVGSLPNPNNLPLQNHVLLPTLSWLAFVIDEKILVWDAQNQRVLLDSADLKDPRAISFSANGHFFVCGTKGREFQIWKGSSTGYLPHQRLVAGTSEVTPLVSPNGKSVVSVGGRILQLWHVTNSPTSLPNISMQILQHSGQFFVEFSPDQLLIAVAEMLSGTITVLDTQSGNPWLVIDAGIKSCGLRVTGDKVIVVGDGNIVAWDLPARNQIFDARRNISNNVWATTFKHSSPIETLHASISPDLNYVAFADRTSYMGGLCIYSLHTGEKLFTIRSDGKVPGFTSDGHEVWCTKDNGQVEQWRIVVEGGSDTVKIKKVFGYITPQSGFPWHSPNGYQVTDDGWILSSSRKRLLWLPHYLEHEKIQRKWGEKFLVAWNESSAEPFILKLEV